MRKIIKSCFLSIILITLTACSGNREMAKPMTFPADMDNPFLISKHILGEKPEARKGMLGKFKTMLFGSKSFMQLIRPVAIAFQGSDVVLVADADAAKILRYKFIDDELLALMRACNFYLLSVAVESASNRVLNLMKKSETFESMRDKIFQIKKHGFDISLFKIPTGSC